LIQTIIDSDCCDSDNHRFRQLTIQTINDSDSYDTDRLSTTKNYWNVSRQNQST